MARQVTEHWRKDSDRETPVESVRNVLEWLKKAGYLAGETAEEKRAYTSNRDLPGSRGTGRTDYVRQMNRS